MKKILLALSLFTAIGLNAQIANNDFEIWQTDTIFFPGLNTIPPDTFEASNPASWTSSNSLTGTDSLGGVFFVTQTNDHHSGSLAAQIITDTINLPTIPSFPLLKLTFPGFIVNGKFPINTSTLLTSGSVISPLSITGAGQPFTTKLGKIKGYYNYAPVFNTNANSYDTCIVWAALKKWNPTTEKSDLIGEAIFKSTMATNGYLPFEANFNYVSCDAPDSLVVFIASSVPNVQAILGGGTSGLMRGSVLKVDSIYYEDLPVNYNFPPIAVNDMDTTVKNTARDIDVKWNDDDCDNAVSGLTIALVSQPANGSAAVNAGKITYTPATNFIGLDSFSYTLNDGTSSSSPAAVRMIVLDNTGIGEVNQVQVNVFPIPASTQLNIYFENPGKCFARVYDMIGNEVLNAALNANSNSIKLNDVANGVYGLQILNNKGQVIARTKFTVNK